LKIVVAYPGEATLLTQVKQHCLPRLSNKPKFARFYGRLIGDPPLRRGLLLTQVKQQSPLLTQEKQQTRPSGEPPTSLFGSKGNPPRRRVKNLYFGFWSLVFNFS